jgi:hypothetical protein
MGRRGYVARRWRADKPPPRLPGMPIFDRSDDGADEERGA